MLEMKKTNIADVSNQDTIVMTFDQNPNIPTAQYSAATEQKILEVLDRKAKAEKLRKLLKSELAVKDKKDEEGNEFDFKFSLGGM